MDSALQESGWQPTAHSVQPRDYWPAEESAFLHHANEQVHPFLPPSLCQAVPCLGLWLLQTAGASRGRATCPAGIDEDHTHFITYLHSCLCSTYSVILFIYRSWVWVPSVYWPWPIVLKWSASPKTCSNCLNFKPANKWPSRTSCRHTIGQSSSLGAVDFHVAFCLWSPFINSWSVNISADHQSRGCFVTYSHTLCIRCFSRDWRIIDYGICDLMDLLTEIPDTTITITHQDTDTVISVPKRGLF